MPRIKKSSGTDDAARGVRDTAATGPQSAADDATIVVPPDVPATAATRAVWAALTANPGATAAELAGIAGVDRSTANKALSVMEGAGRAVRSGGGHEGAKRLPARWQAVSATDAAHETRPPVAGASAPSPEPEQPEPASRPAAARQDADTEPEAEAPEGAVQAPAGGEHATGPEGGGGRLAPGALREMVVNYLRDRPDQALSPSAIGRALGRSAGAVANACLKLMEEGQVTQASERPRQYRIVS